MKSITTKLFLAMLGLTVIVLMVTMALARWSFGYGFAEYRQSLESERLGNMAEQLSVHYLENDAKWGNNISAIFDHIQLRSLRQGPRPSGHRPARSGEMNHKIIQSQKHLRPDKPFGDRGPPPFKHRRGGPKPSSHFTGLYENTGNHIAGDSLPNGAKDIIFVSIMAGSKRVGELRAIAPKSFNTPDELAFSNHQKLASILIAVLSLLLAGLASWWLSRTLLAPILRLKDAVATLAQGDYTVQLESPRRDELGALEADVNRLAITLEQSRNSRRRWLADISHELRTPVTILAGEVEAISDGVRPLSIEGVDSLGHEVERLKHLIDDLYQLSLSDIGGINYRYESLQLKPWLSTLTGQFMQRTKEKGLTLSLNYKNECTISADEMRIEQLFTNLLNNSIAYTDAPGNISISLSVERGIEKDYAVVQIEDSAPGVEKDNMKFLFDPLFREETSRDRRSGGAGLGLSISQSIVQAHQGEIEALESALGGFCMRVKLPLVVTA